MDFYKIEGHRSAPQVFKESILANRTGKANSISLDLPVHTTHVRRQRNQADNTSVRVPEAVVSTQCVKFRMAPLSLSPLSHDMSL